MPIYVETKKMTSQMKTSNISNVKTNTLNRVWTKTVTPTKDNEFFDKIAFHMVKRAVKKKEFEKIRPLVDSLSLEDYVSKDTESSKKVFIDRINWELSSLIEIHNSKHSMIYKLAKFFTSYRQEAYSIGTSMVGVLGVLSLFARQTIGWFLVTGFVIMTVAPKIVEEIASKKIAEYLYNKNLLPPIIYCEKTRKKLEKYITPTQK